MIKNKTQTLAARRLRLQLNGIVQGVGFRPFVYKLAQSMDLSGYVSNSSSGVLIEIEGSETDLRHFLQRLTQEAPPLSDIIDLKQQFMEPQFGCGFEIKPSATDLDNRTLIAPDIALCQDCLSELFDPDDRRYLYPFINCTNCGPRYTIIKNIPYDRPFTSMAHFKMCPECQAEYYDPANRRFHAQPNACPLCGPQLWYEYNGSTRPLFEKDEAIDQIINDLLAGKIVAIKGLGGFHLAVDASNEQAILRLRERKYREEKPLAIMVPDLETVKALAFLNKKEQKLLESPQAPIVLLVKRSPIPISEQVAPGNKRLGIMLPYTPLHYLLFERLQKLKRDKCILALVMTSANLSEEPIAVSNEDARERLGPIADSFLMHNREILVRADDSVLLEVNEMPLFFRRSRGYVPRPIFIDQAGPPILAVGAELKNTICLLKDDHAFLSQHIGDLENLQANEFFRATIEYLQKILEFKPEAIVHDLHPGYFSTQWAKEQTNIPLFAVQHHHAHLASCMAEWKLTAPVIGIILDGSGYGYDQTIWGGEILVADFLRLKRIACLEPMPLPGGDAAIKEPWRTAFAYCYECFGEAMAPLPIFNNRPMDILKQMLDKKINSPLTSSCGRLFDALAAMSGGRSSIKYEAQAAIEMMQAVETMKVKPFDYECALPHIPVKPIVKEVAQAIQKGQPFKLIAAKFHKTLIELFSDVAVKVRTETGIHDVVLSGGVFQNEIIFKNLTLLLQRNGFNVYNQRQVPPNDGGISLGQALIGQKLMLSGQEKVIFETFTAPAR